MKDSSAACLVIGDEILTGKVHDRNSHLLAQVLFERGVRLQRIETVPDELDDIASSVRRLSERFTYVFTSGGIGPTHDDMTYAGIAQAFGVELGYHQPTLDAFAAYYQSRGRGELNDARKRMALIPEGAQVWSTPDSWVPFVVMANVHVLPGVPELFEKMLLANAHRFAGIPLFRTMLYTDSPEGDIADTLAKAQAAHPNVAIGSYPKYGRDAGYSVKITLEGLPEAEVRGLASELREALGARWEARMDVESV
jgi:molybdenum cofactor synthesis domain-containing protein